MMKKKIKIVMFVLLLCLGIVISCTPAPVRSRAGSISAGTLRYLYVVMPGIKSPEEFIVKIKKQEAKGQLADRQGLKKDPHYKKFLILSKRTRESRGAVVILKEVYGKAVPVDGLTKISGFQGRIKQAAEEIVRSRIRESNRIELNREDILLGNFEKGKIFLYDLKPHLLQEEWRRLKSLSTSPLEKALKDSLNIFIKSYLNAKLMERLDVDEDEANRFDFNEVADLFLSRRYGLASEGIYPVTTYELPLTPPELFEHFARMRTRWNPIDSVEASAAVVKDLATARKFVDALKKESFYSLALRYSRDMRFIERAKQHTFKLGPDNQKSADGFDMVQRLILETARQNSYKPEIFRIFRGYAIVKVKKIHFIQGKYSYNDYRDFVKISLTRKLLEKQFPVDLADMEKKLSFSIDVSRVEKILKMPLKKKGD